jgi:hypothetical protein
VWQVLTHRVPLDSSAAVCGAYNKETAMIASTSARVKVNTSEEVNEHIRSETHHRVCFYAQNPELIDKRLKELDEEWDVERMLETGASTLTLTGLVMGVAVNRKWLLLSLAVQGFFMQHALQGWCPPLPVLRKLGFRTADEISVERFALKALRGDFKDVGTGSEGAADALEAAGM